MTVTVGRRTFLAGPTRFELVLNLKAAKIIDHQVPAGLVARADKVVE